MAENKAIKLEQLKYVKQYSEDNFIAKSSVGDGLNIDETGKLHVTVEGLTVDDSLSDTSKNPVQNKVVNAALNNKANLSDIPTELPANGGNADTVDGKHASDFMQNLGYLTTGSLLDYVLTLTSSGSFFAGGSVTDTPISGLFYGVDVIRHTGGDFVITATRFNGGGVWTNRYNAGNKKWYGWANVADGGDAKTVNGHTVESDVPADAEFTDTKYTHPSYTARTGVPTANATPAFGGSFTVSQPVSDSFGHITAINNRTITIPSSVSTTSANGLMSSTDKSKLNYTNVAYGTCTTDAATSAKVVTISGNSNWSLAVGSIIAVKFSNSNTASNVTLNVNNTGAKSIWYNTAVYTGANVMYTGTANRPIMYIYDGTYWVFIGHSAEYTYGLATATTNGLVSTGSQTFAGSKTFQETMHIRHSGYTKGSTAPSTMQFKAYRFLDKNNKQIGEFSNYVDTNNNTVSKMLAVAATSLDGKIYSQIATLINADASYICHVCTTPTTGRSSLRQMASGTADATTSNCPSGAWYGKHS